MNVYCEHDICRQYIFVGIPQQKRVAKRMNRTLATRDMLRVDS